MEKEPNLQNEGWQVETEKYQRSLVGFIKAAYKEERGSGRPKYDSFIELHASDAFEATKSILTDPEVSFDEIRVLYNNGQPIKLYGRMPGGEFFLSGKALQDFMNVEGV